MSNVKLSAELEEPRGEGDLDPEVFKKKPPKSKKKPRKKPTKKLSRRDEE